MFAIGGLLPRDELRAVLRDARSVFGGTAIQYGTMPALAYVFSLVFGLEGDLRVGVILVGCVPGAMASNVLTLLARGNVSYSVSLTTTATLLSPLIVPLALYLTLQRSDVDAEAIAVQSFRDLLVQVVAPVLAGHFLARRSAALERIMARLGPIAANVAILWIIAVVVNANAGQYQRAGFALLAALAAVNLLGYLAGYAGGIAMRLPDTKRRALTIEIGMQNAGLGATLAQQLFPGADPIALPAALYTFGCMLTGTLLAQWWSRRCSDNR
jgi:BASS family bile acid:Na+ symporter